MEVHVLEYLIQAVTDQFSSKIFTLAAYYLDRSPDTLFKSCKNKLTNIRPLKNTTFDTVIII